MSSANYSVSGLAAFSIATAVLAIVSVALRFWSRAVSNRVYFGWDDWLALAALAPTVTTCGLVYAVCNVALGANAISLPEQEYMLKLMFAGDIVFNLSISASKLSALAFYGRVFNVRSNPSKLWRYSFYIILALACLWPLIIIPYTAVRCNPIQKYWQPNMPGSCLPQFDHFMSSAVASTAIDVLILLAPLPQVFRLQTTLKKRMLIICTFVIGYGAAAISLGRMIVTAQLKGPINADFSLSIIQLLYWFVAESGFSLLAVCLPALFQLGRRVYSFGARSLVSSKDFSSVNKSRDAPNRAYKRGSAPDENDDYQLSRLLPPDAPGAMRPSSDIPATQPASYRPVPDNTDRHSSSGSQDERASRSLDAHRQRDV